MGPESTSASTSVPSPPAASGKRCRDPEDEVYVNNLHSQKRYLSEVFCIFFLQIMASSLNGLTVGDSLPYNLMDSTARSESMFYSRADQCLLLGCDWRVRKLLQVPLDIIELKILRASMD